MERMDASIESAEDLAKQSKIKYGAVLGGSTLAFFQVYETYFSNKVRSFYRLKGLLNRSLSMHDRVMIFFYRNSN